MRTCMFVIVVVLSVTLVACYGYETGGPDDSEGLAWDPLSIQEIQEMPDVHVGRLWVSPNPVVFGVDSEGYTIRDFQIEIANIGSEEAVIDDITMSGDPDFDFYGERPHDGHYPKHIGGDPECNGHAGMGFPIVYADVTGDGAAATMVVHTSDPTSPTVKVPVYRNPELVYENHYMDPVEGLRPIVKPNPIRIDRHTVKGEKRIEVCLALLGWGDPLFRFTKIEAFGASVAVAELLDYQGNPVTLPHPPDVWTADPNRAVISYKPQMDADEDGALVVHFEEDSGRQQALVVPIVIR
jgi:hypothetical protein